MLLGGQGSSEDRDFRRTGLLQGQGSCRIGLRGGQGSSSKDRAPRRTGRLEGQAPRRTARLGGQGSSEDGLLVRRGLLRVQFFSADKKSVVSRHVTIASMSSPSTGSCEELLHMQRSEELKIKTKTKNSMPFMPSRLPPPPPPGPQGQGCPVSEMVTPWLPLMVNLSQYKAAPRAHHKRAPERTENYFRNILPFVSDFCRMKICFAEAAAHRFFKQRPTKQRRISLYLRSIVWILCCCNVPLIGSGCPWIATSSGGAGRLAYIILLSTGNSARLCKKGAVAHICIIYYNLYPI